jgi:cellulose synthase/poly-beta-1,6-N-acetylglucosamine synthase-like glycosyltransferase
MYDSRNVALLIALFVVLLACTVQPLSRRHDDSDRGSGAVVDMPPLRRRSLPRAFVFLALAAVTSVGLVGMRNPTSTADYQNLVAQVLTFATRDPATAQSYADHLLLLIPVAVIGAVVILAIMLPATPGRRLMILLHAPLFLAISVLTDCFVGLISLGTGLPVGPTPIVNMILQYTLSNLLLLRLVFTTWQLPRVSQVPNRRQGDWFDHAVLASCVVGALGMVSALAFVLLRHTGNQPVITFLILIGIRAAVFDVTCALLGLYKLAGGRAPRPGGPTPLINVIIPAYNEELVIERLLRSIDRAAANYGGPVRVILCDDGSTDATRALAETAMAAYGYASGMVIQGEHGGKSKALNNALTHCTADFVFRVDADCALDSDAFVYSIPHFLADRRVGMVGAFSHPKEPYTTWIDRMRLIELVFSSGYTWPTVTAIDGIYCIPGTFTAFRREAALAVGGFVHGMLGEDVEFTCAVARLGYRAVVDPRVVSYEDVPDAVGQLRVQRWRWCIGSLFALARFTPFGGRSVSPRFWFQMSKGGGSRLLLPAHFFYWMLSIEYAVFDPGVRHNLLRFAVLLLIAQLPSLASRLLVLAYYRRAGVLLWAPLWIPFAFLKRLFNLDGMLSLRPRPVKPPVALRPHYPSWADLFGAVQFSHRPPSAADTAARPYPQISGSNGE